MLASLIVLFFLIPVFGNISYAQGSQTDFLTSCPPGVVSKDCQPPTLQQIEFTLVRFLYAIWGSAGIIFLVLMIYNGYLYMFSGGDEEKIREARTRTVQWAIGFVLLFISVPIVSTIMKIFIKEGECFGQLTDPGFSFFFADVCTSGDPVPSFLVPASPVPTP